MRDRHCLPKKGQRRGEGVKSSMIRRGEGERQWRMIFRGQGEGFVAFWFLDEGKGSVGQGRGMKFIG